jgi:hypothetical protein
MYRVLSDDFRKDVPAMLDQVHLRYLRVSSQERADELVGRLGDGASFAALQEEVESDEESPGYSSDLAWYTQETLERGVSADIAAQAFGINSGVFAQESDGMYYVVEVVDHQMREVDDDLAERLANVALLDWIESQQALVERLEYDPGYVLVEPPATSENPLMNP